MEVSCLNTHDRIVTFSKVTCSRRNLWEFCSIMDRICKPILGWHIASYFPCFAGADILVCADSSRNGATAALESAPQALHGKLHRSFGRLIPSKIASCIVWIDNVRCCHGGEVRKGSEEANKKVRQPHYICRTGLWETRCQNCVHTYSTLVPELPCQRTSVRSGLRPVVQLYAGTGVQKYYSFIQSLEYNCILLYYYW
jgi:hypothetical protein